MATYYTSNFGFGAGSANREDFEDVIVRLSPEEVPFYSAAPKIPIQHTTHEWLESALASAVGTARGEGAAFSSGTLTARTRVSATTQIFGKDIEISKSQLAVNPAGVDDDMAYEVDTALREISRNIEKRCFSNVSADATVNARRMKSLSNWLTTAGQTVNGSADGASGHAKATLDSLLEKLFIAGGFPDRLYMFPSSKVWYSRELVGATNSILAGGASGSFEINTRNIDARSGMIDGNVDVYRSNFGVIQLVPDRFMPRATGMAATGALAAPSVDAETSLPANGNIGRIYAIETSKVAIGVLRPIQPYALPMAGDSERAMILGELALIVRGAATAHGTIDNVINSTTHNS